MKRTDDVVSASEIASWAWCPESWRLGSLGSEPGNRGALRRGERLHTRTARLERWSAFALRLGVRLLIAALLLAVLASVLVGG